MTAGVASTRLLDHTRYPGTPVAWWTTKTTSQQPITTACTADTARAAIACIAPAKMVLGRGFVLVSARMHTSAQQPDLLFGGQRGCMRRKWMGRRWMGGRWMGGSSDGHRHNLPACTDVRDVTCRTARGCR